MVLDAILSMDYWLLIVILSLIVTLISTLTYKYTTDQKKIKRYRKEVKEMQKEMKKHKDDQKKMMKMQQEMLAKNGELMKQSFKPMLYTFIPLLLILGWMNAAIAYEPIEPGVPFALTATLDDNYMGNLSDVTLKTNKPLQIKKDPNFQAEGNQIRWILNANESGTYTFLIEGESFKETKDVIVTNKKEYAAVQKTYDSQLKRVTLSNKEVKPFEGLPVVGGLNWLWSYIILSVLMSIGLRKLLDVA